MRAFIESIAIDLGVAAIIVGGAGALFFLGAIGLVASAIAKGTPEARSEDVDPAPGDVPYLPKELRSLPEDKIIRIRGQA